VDLFTFRNLPEVAATQADVAAGTGLSQATISRLESGEIEKPSWEVVNAVRSWAAGVARRKRLPRAKRLTWPSDTATAEPAGEGPEASRAAG